MKIKTVHAHEKTGFSSHQESLELSVVHGGKHLGIIANSFLKASVPQIRWQNEMLGSFIAK